MSSWITYEQAAGILGCHVSNVPNLLAKRQLRSRGHVRDGSLSRRQVEALARRRAEQRKEQTSRPPRRYQRIDHRPDHVHEWLSVRQVAEMLGVTRPAVMGRIHRERLPAIEIHGRYWVRADHLALVERARLASRTHLP